MKAIELFLTAALAAAAPRSWAAQPASPAAGAAAKATAASTPPAPDVSTVYTGDQARDPFLKSAGSAAAKPAAAEEAVGPPEFSIHSLTLRALMKDGAADYALLTDVGAGQSYVLRQGKLYDAKDKRVPGVTGSINIKARRVVLKTPDQDVQTLRLGEEEKESNP